MKEQEFLDLRDGDLIRSRMSGAAYLVQKTDGDLTATGALLSISFSAREHAPIL